MVMVDKTKGYGHSEYNTPSDRCDQGEIVELENRSPGQLETLDPGPTHHHVVEVVQQPAPGHGNQIVNLVAVCSCGWRFGEHQIYLYASTSWVKERARHQLEDAGSAHIRSMKQESEDLPAPDFSEQRLRG